MKRSGGATKTAAWLLIILFVAMGIVLGGYNLSKGNVSRALLGFCATAFLLVPVFMKAVGLAHPYRMYILLFAFCIMAYNVGCVYQGFDQYPFFDKVSHFLSGILFTIMGFCFYFVFRKPVPQKIQDNWLLSCTYALGFSLFVAVIWEVGEFTGFVITGHDSQHTLTTGVFDTMEDLIACLIGSIISIGSFMSYALGKAKLLTPWVVEEFHYLVKKKSRK